MNQSVWEKLHDILYEMELFKIQDVGITINHILVATITVLAAMLLSKILQHLVRSRIFKRINIDVGIEYTLLRIIHFLILAIGLYIGLATLNIPMGAILGMFAVLGVGIGFGLQNLVSNFVSGIILLLERPIKIGDRIEIGGVWGDVQKISLRTTIVRTPDNITIIVPNSKLLENDLTNYSYGERTIRIRVPVGVAYGSDVPKVFEALEAAAKTHEEVLESPSPAAWFREFGESSLHFELLAWIENPARKYWIISDLNRAIEQRFREEGIHIPFPQHDIHVRSIEASFPCKGPHTGKETNP